MIEKPMRNIGANKYTKYILLFTVHDGEAYIDFVKATMQGNFSLKLPKRHYKEVLKNELLLPPVTRVAPYFDDLLGFYTAYVRNELCISQYECEIIVEKIRGETCKGYRFLLNCFKQFFENTRRYEIC